MKSIRNTPPPARSSKSRELRTWLAIFTVSILMIIGLTTGGFLVGLSKRSQVFDAAVARGLPEQNRMQAVLDGPGNYLRSILGEEEPEKLLFDIKFKHMERIRASRDKALELGVLNTSSEDFVPANIRYLNRSIPVKLRLKGDNTDHLQGNKWSFLVKVRGDDQLFGMRRFSLMNPIVRGNQAEPMAFEFLRKLGLLAPRYSFVDMTINGRHIGMMALEEYPAKELLESQGRRESVVIRFDESQVWDDLAHKGYSDPHFGSYSTAPIKAAQGGKVRKSVKLSKYFATAAGLLKAQVRGNLSASQVFNIAEYVRFLAALEVLDAANGFWWGNSRFYYNPISARLEPLGSDLMSETIWSESNNSRIPLHSMDNQHTRDILADPDVREAFVRELQKLVKEVEDGSVEKFLKPFDQKWRALLHRDLPLLAPFNFDHMKRRAAHLSKATVENLDYFNLMPEVGQPFLLHAQVIRTGENGLLDLTNVTGTPVEVVDIRLRSKSGGPQVPLSTTTSLDYPLMLRSVTPDSIAKVTSIPFAYTPELTDGSQIEIVARIQGTDRTYVTIALNSYSPLDQRPVPSESLSELLERHPFLRQLDESTLTVQPGQHLVNQTISTPPGYELQIPADTKLLFAPDASLVVSGSLKMTGTADQEIILEGQETLEGNAGWWRGITVLDTRRPSFWRHVRIRNTTGVKHGNWELTGGVTFYQSKVRLENVTFEASRAEDALNIVRSDFELKNVVIMNTVSDGLDSDFSQGSIEDGTFVNIGTAGGGDAVDISGSVVSVTGTRFRNVDDKALSVGEGSQMTATGVHIEGALTGAASKDASRLEISSSIISNVRVAGMMAYVKKPEYGPASIEANNVQLLGNSSDALVQTGSEIKIDGEIIPSSDLDVDELYESFMKKASR
jgi:hypothetical protein